MTDYSKLVYRSLAILALLLTPQFGGEIKRSRSALHEFAKVTPCPAPDAKTKRQITHCPGYVIDHIVPLACHGLDEPVNMQWQSIADGKAKDKWERKDCSIWFRR